MAWRWWSSPAPSDKQPAKPRRLLVGWRRWSLLCVLLCYLLLRFAARRSIALQALLLVPWAYPQLSGVPSLCGSDGRRTWSWMNPGHFNVTGNKRGAAGVFLVGCGHSGTTPLTNVLSRHPQIWLYAPDEALEFSVKPSSFRTIPPFVDSRRDDDRFNFAVKSKNSTRWLVKSPSNVCRIGYILATLPSARVVHLVRDGRDVMLSLLERYPDADPAGPLVLARWVNDNKAALLYSPDPRLLVLKYEDLFAHRNRGRPALPAEGYPTLKRVLGHIGVATAPLVDMLARHGEEEEHNSFERKPVASEEHTALRAAQIKKPFERSKPRWPTQMTPRLATIFKRDPAAVALLRRFGYAANSSSW